jgi:hypothetical protein
VVAHRLAAWVEVARDYRRFVVSRLATLSNSVMSSISLSRKTAKKLTICPRK